LGAFFRRLARRKNRNVAITAVARKLVTVAFLMSKHREPHRYARPELRRQQFARLRNGEEASHGVSARAKRKAGLAEVYPAAGLPAVTPPEELPRGESQMLRDRDLEEFVAELYQPAKSAARGKEKVASHGKATRTARPRGRCGQAFFTDWPPLRIRPAGGATGIPAAEPGPRARGFWEAELRCPMDNLVKRPPRGGGQKGPH
jgi:hypothetical protein